jgi:hypothetical protein
MSSPTFKNSVGERRAIINRTACESGLDFRIVYSAVRNSPEWDKNLLLILLDEHGGCIDHVPPPTTIGSDKAEISISEPEGSRFTFVTNLVCQAWYWVARWVCLAEEIRPANRIDGHHFDCRQEIPSGGFVCCGGGAESPTTAADVPAGIELITTGSVYWSVANPILNSDKFSLTTYCGPSVPALSTEGCSVKVTVMAHYQYY